MARPPIRLSYSLCRLSTTSTVSPSSPGPVKPYTDIPMKKGLRKYFDYFGPKPQEVFYKRERELGPIYREKMMPFAPVSEMLVVCDPNDVEAVFRADGKWPYRDALPFLRDVREKVLKIPKGIFFVTEYEEWSRSRKPMSQFTMVPRKVGEYHNDFNKITNDLIHVIQVLRNPNTNMLTDVPSLLFKWSFEAVCLFVLGKRLGALNIDNVPEDCQNFINSIRDLGLSSQKLLFSPPLYKIYSTRAWKLLAKSSRETYEISMKHIQEKIKEIKENEEKLKNDSEEVILPEQVDFLTYMLHRSDLSIEEISVNAVDLLSGGVESTSYTLAWTLYCLATNHSVQTKLRNEIMDVIGKEEIVTPEHIHNLPYLRHCIKEAQRLYPIASSNIRIVKKDIVLSGYHIPKETTVLLPTYVMGRLPHLFPEPELYRPERWNKKAVTTGDDQSPSPPHQFASLPFGFGPRMCVGRRVAELELNIALAHIIKTFTVDYTDTTPLEPTMKLVLVPNRQMDLTFTKNDM